MKRVTEGRIELPPIHWTSLIRQTARIWSLFSLAVMMLFFIGEGVDPTQLAFHEWVGLLFFPIGISVGLILAWRWEEPGGAITVGSLAAFYVNHFIATGAWPRGPYFILLAFPGFLFLLCWLRSYGLFRFEKRVT